VLVLHTKDNPHDSLHLTELLRVQLVSHFDVFVVSPGDLEREVCGCELNEPEPEVTGVDIMIVGSM
jgi:hypothetical protein